MTTEDEALVVRLRAGYVIGRDAPRMLRRGNLEAADRIEALAAEVERLQAMVGKLCCSYCGYEFPTVLAEDVRRDLAALHMRDCLKHPLYEMTKRAEEAQAALDRERARVKELERKLKDVWAEP